MGSGLSYGNMWTCPNMTLVVKTDDTKPNWDSPVKPQTVISTMKYEVCHTSTDAGCDRVLSGQAVKNSQLVIRHCGCKFESNMRDGLKTCPGVTFTIMKDVKTTNFDFSLCTSAKVKLHSWPFVCLVVHLFVCLSAGLRKYYCLDLHDKK